MFLLQGFRQFILVSMRPITDAITSIREDDKIGNNIMKGKFLTFINEGILCI